MSSSRRWPWEAQKVHSRQSERRAKEAHQANRWLTIFLPLGVGSILVLALAVWLVTGTGAATMHQASAAVIIFMSLGCMGTGVLVLVVLIALTVGVNRLYGHVPQISQRLLSTLYSVQQSLAKASDKAVSPIVRWRALRAAVSTVWRALRAGAKS